MLRMRLLQIVMLVLAGFGPGVAVVHAQVGDSTAAERDLAARAELPAHSRMVGDDVVVLERPEVAAHSNWARVMVVDARPDTTRIGTTWDGRCIRFNTSASAAIAHHLQAVVGMDAEKDRTIRIVIEKLNISYLPKKEGRLEFLAEIYEQKTDTGWLKISTCHRTRMVGGSVASGMGKLLSSVIGAIDVGLTVTGDGLPLVSTREMYGVRDGAGQVDPDPYVAGAGLEHPILNRREWGQAGY